MELINTSFRQSKASACLNHSIPLALKAFKSRRNYARRQQLFRKPGDESGGTLLAAADGGEAGDGEICQILKQFQLERT